MAKATTAKAPKKAKKSKKPAKAVTLKAKAGGGKKAGAKSKAKDGFDALVKLAEHPLVGELLAVGAMAAVAVIAEEGLSSKTKKKVGASAQSVKSAGKAAATAIGKRLIAEFEDVKMVSKKA